MPEYIEKEALIKEMQTSHKPTFAVIAEAPTADVAEVKHGYWIYHLDDLFPAESTQECSICHEEEDITLCNDNFCPNCGARMDGKESDENV